MADQGTKCNVAFQKEIRLADMQISLYMIAAISNSRFRSARMTTSPDNQVSDYKVKDISLAGCELWPTVWSVITYGMFSAARKAKR